MEGRKRVRFTDVDDGNALPARRRSRPDLASEIGTMVQSLPRDYGRYSDQFTSGKLARTTLAPITYGTRQVTVQGKKRVQTGMSEGTYSQDYYALLSQLVAGGSDLANASALAEKILRGTGQTIWETPPKPIYKWVADPGATNTYTVLTYSRNNAGNTGPSIVRTMRISDYGSEPAEHMDVWDMTPDQAKWWKKRLGSELEGNKVDIAKLPKPLQDAYWKAFYTAFKDANTTSQFDSKMSNAMYHDGEDAGQQGQTALAQLKAAAVAAGIGAAGTVAKTALNKGLEYAMQRAMAAGSNYSLADIKNMIRNAVRAQAEETGVVDATNAEAAMDAEYPLAQSANAPLSAFGTAGNEGGASAPSDEDMNPEFDEYDYVPEAEDMGMEFNPANLQRIEYTVGRDGSLVEHAIADRAPGLAGRLARRVSTRLPGALQELGERFGANSPAYVRALLRLTDNSQLGEEALANLGETAAERTGEEIATRVARALEPI